MKKNIFLLVGNLFLSIMIAKAQPPQPGKPPNPEERLKEVAEKIDKELKLSSTQKEKITKAYRDFFADMEKQRSKDGKPMPPPPPPPPVNKEVADKLSGERDAKIKAVLSAEQYQKYAALEKTMRPPMPGEKTGEPKPPKGDKKQSQ
jgi:hypothetical protein